MITAVLPLASILGDLGETAGEMWFVIKLMALAYILFWLFVTFQDNQTLFAFSALVASYFVLFYASAIVVIAVVILLMVNGMFLQQSIQFGLLPALGRDQMGHPVDYAHQNEMMQAQQLQTRLEAGQKLSADEMNFLAQVQQRQATANAQLQNYMQPGGYGSQYGQQGSYNQVGMRRMR